MKLSNIIGKQVFVIYDASFLGTVNDVAFDNKFTKILGFYFFDQDENEFFIKTQNIYSIDDFITIKNNSKISNEFLLDKPLLPLGKNIVSVFGKDYGNVCDIEFDDKYKITSFLSNKNQSISPTDIINISKNIVVGNNLKLSSFKAKKPKTNNQTLENLSVSIMKMPDPQPYNKRLMPSKITVNSDVLIGKKLSKDIIGKNNELILKQDQILTAKQVILAKQHDKLNELFFSVY